MAKTLMCYGCREKFLKEELVAYAGTNAKITHNYCKNCLAEKQARERFSIQVCQIFGLKSPGPRIWTERKRLIDTFGYTDDIIIDCLEYIYKVEKKKKLVESLCLVNPVTVEHMRTYKKRIENSNQQIVRAIATTKMIEHIVPVKENTKTIKKEWNPDDWLDCD